ncbi:MAG: hypothetical protein PVF87_10380 [Acidimicrobiia bacterium]|jgi:hypothetical protein
MSRDFWGVASGLVVLALGVTAVLALLGPAEEPTAAEVVALPTTTSTWVTTTEAVAPPDLPGVPADVTRALEWNGDASLATEDEMTQLPPSVAAVLIEYGVPLRVPLAGGQ